MALLLKNGAKIDELGLADAFVEIDEATRYFLDTLTGDVGSVDVSAPDAKLPAVPRYIEVPRIGADAQLAWLTDMIVEDLDGEADAELIASLSGLIARGGDPEDILIECEHALEAAGMIDAWDDWTSDPLWDEIERWLASLPVPIEDHTERCGECDVCLMLGDGPHTLGDLLEAKQKAARHKKKDR